MDVCVCVWGGVVTLFFFSGRQSTPFLVAPAGVSFSHEKGKVNKHIIGRSFCFFLHACVSKNT